MENYHILERIGSGSYGKVYKGRKKYTGKIVALKFISKHGKTEEEILNLRRELDILRELDHVNIIAMIDSFETEKEFCMATEYAQGDLYQILEDDTYLPELEVKKIAIQLVYALHYLHSNRIIHRDMKPHNILIGANQHVKLCDFGFARTLSRNTILLTSIKGTPLYMAPELVKHEPYNYTVDLWSLGVILYELATGKPPFYTENICSLIKMIVENNIIYPDTMSNELKLFIQGLLEKNPKKRLNWPELLKNDFIFDNETYTYYNEIYKKSKKLDNNFVSNLNNNQEINNDKNEIQNNIEMINTNCKDIFLDKKEMSRQEKWQYLDTILSVHTMDVLEEALQVNNNFFFHDIQLYLNSTNHKEDDSYNLLQYILPITIKIINILIKNKPEKTNDIKETNLWITIFQTFSTIHLSILNFIKYIYNLDNNEKEFIITRSQISQLLRILIGNMSLFHKNELTLNQNNINNSSNIYKLDETIERKICKENCHVIQMLLDMENIKNKTWCDKQKILKLLGAIIDLTNPMDYLYDILIDKSKIISQLCYIIINNNMYLNDNENTKKKNKNDIIENNISGNQIYAIHALSSLLESFEEKSNFNYLFPYYFNDYNKLNSTSVTNYLYISILCKNRKKLYEICGNNISLKTQDNTIQFSLFNLKSYYFIFYNKVKEQNSLNEMNNNDIDRSIQEELLYILQNIIQIFIYSSISSESFCFDILSDELYEMNEKFSNNKNKKIDFISCIIETVYYITEEIKKVNKDSRIGILLFKLKYLCLKLLVNVTANRNFLKMNKYIDILFKIAQENVLNFIELVTFSNNDFLIKDVSFNLLVNIINSIYYWNIEKIEKKNQNVVKMKNITEEIVSVDFIQTIMESCISFYFSKNNEICNYLYEKKNDFQLKGTHDTFIIILQKIIFLLLDTNNEDNTRNMIINNIFLNKFNIYNIIKQLFDVENKLNISSSTFPGFLSPKGIIKCLKLLFQMDPTLILKEINISFIKIFISFISPKHIQKLIEWSKAFEENNKKENNIIDKIIFIVIELLNKYLLNKIGKNSNDLTEEDFNNHFTQIPFIHNIMYILCLNNGKNTFINKEKILEFLASFMNKTGFYTNKLYIETFVKNENGLKIIYDLNLMKINDNCLISCLEIFCMISRHSNEFYDDIYKANLYLFLRDSLLSNHSKIRAKSCHYIGNLARHSDYFYKEFIKIIPLNNKNNDTIYETSKDNLKLNTSFNLMPEHHEECSILDILIYCCKDIDFTVRKFATFAIGNLAFHSSYLYSYLSPAVPSLLLCLKDVDDKTRINAGGALGNLIRNSDQLIKIMTKENPTIENLLQTAFQDPCIGPRRIVLFSIGNFFTYPSMYHLSSENNNYYYIEIKKKLNLLKNNLKDEICQKNINRILNKMEAITYV